MHLIHVTHLCIVNLLTKHQPILFCIVNPFIAQQLNYDHDMKSTLNLLFYS